MWHHVELCDPDAAFRQTASLDYLYSGSASSERVPFQIESGEPGPDDLADSDVANAAVRRFVCRLSPRERDIATRIFWEGESQSDVARSLGVSRMAISKATTKILARGRQQLAAFKNRATA